MRFEITTNDGYVKVVNVHNEEILFDISSYSGARLDSVGDIFRPINDFISRQPTLTQAAIFGLYMEAKDIFMKVRHEETLDTRLKDFFRRLFQVVNVDSLHAFVEIHSGIIIPSEIKASYTDVEAGFMRDKTYIREEYIDLLANTVLVRLCFPIWGEYMSIVDAYATAEGKEYHAYTLLQQSILPRLPAYKKLLSYVVASTTTSIETASATLKGVGRDSIPEWLTAMVIVRKLPIIDLYNSQGKGNIINAVYSYVDNHLKRLSKKFFQDARERKNEGSGGSDEKDQSFIETYRSKQEISYGQLETNIVYLEDDLGLACQHIDPTFDMSIIEEVQRVSGGLENEAFFNHNHIITQWVVDKSISTLQPDIMERKIAVRSMYIAQALLHHWGLHYLALSATGIRLQNSASNQLGDRVARVTAEQLAKLDEIYPNQVPTPGHKSGNRNKNANYGYLTVMEMATELTRYRYAVRTPGFLTVKDVPGIDRYGHMQVPPTITHELVELIVKLDELSP